jgi:hypothetical protein
MKYIGFVDIGLDHDLAVEVDCSELMKRSIYERIQFQWSHEYISKYIKVYPIQIKRGKCGPLV